MWPRIILQRILQIVLLILFIMYFNSIVKGDWRSEKIPIGVVFDRNTDEVQNAFRLALAQNSNESQVDFQVYADVINTADAFKLSRLICNRFARGVISMLGAVTPDSFDTLHSYSNTFQIPFVTPSFPEKVLPPSSGLVDFAVSIQPDYHKAVIDTITFYGWKSIIYVYDSHDGLLRLQQLYQSLQPGSATFRITNVKRVRNASEVVEFLNEIERMDRWSRKIVVLDSTTKLAKDVLISHVRDVKLGRRNYHYFLSGLVMDDRWEREFNEFGAINITGFRVLDFSRKIVRDIMKVWKVETVSAQAALMHDAVRVLMDSIQRLIRKKPDLLRAARRNSNANTSRIIDCNPKGKINTYEHGEKISRMIKKTEIEGLTGPIRFDEVGHRKNFSLQVMEMTVEGDMVKVATWYDDKGLIPVVRKLQPLNAPGVYDRSKTYIVSTILEAPYVIRQKSDSETNDPFKGFCVDLAKMLSYKLEIKYELRPVKDGKYGSENPKIVGGWDGMVGEIIRKEADMVIAPITVTVERETVVDFSKPFLSFDVKPNKMIVRSDETIFSFLRPLSKETWVCIALGAISVSVVLYLVSRCSPHEWRVVTYTDQSAEATDIATKTTTVNEFSFWNSVWFSLGSFLQQGSDITPRSLSGRIVTSVWWFFTLIVVCSYTANLASYLTLSRISEPTQLYRKITSCPEDTTVGQKTIIQATSGDSSSWLGFLLDRSMGRSSESSADKPCEMVVTIANAGIQDFAVALPKGSKLRDGVNLALQALRNDGELQNLIRKWFSRSDCIPVDQVFGGSELTLSQVAGIFYVLLFGLVIGLAVAFLEFCQKGRQDAARANISLRAALTAKARMTSRAELKPPTQGSPQRDFERLPWNGGAYTGYYAPANQINQEDTAPTLQTSFAQV